MVTQAKLGRTGKASLYVRIKIGDGKWQSPACFRDMKETDLLAMFDEASKAECAVVFRKLVPAGDMEAVITSLRMQYDDMIAVKEDNVQKKEEAPAPLNGVTLDDIGDLTQQEEIIACTIFTARYEMPDAPNLILRGDSGSGKSWACKYFEHEDICTRYDVITENALLPGRSGTDDTTRQGILAENHGKAIIIDEASTIFAGGKDAVEKRVAVIVAVAGRSSACIGDAGGTNVVDKCRTRFILGMTKKTYRRNHAWIEQIGTRFLVVSFPTIRGVHHLDNDISPERKELFGNVLRCAWKRVKKFPSPAESDEIIIEEAYLFAHFLSVARSILDMWSMRDGEGEDRYAKQIINLANARAILHRRAPSNEDVQFFERFYYDTIPNHYTLRCIIKKETEGLTEKQQKKAGMIQDHVARLNKDRMEVDLGDALWEDFCRDALDSRSLEEDEDDQE